MVALVCVILLLIHLAEGIVTVSLGVFMRWLDSIMVGTIGKIEMSQLNEVPFQGKWSTGYSNNMGEGFDV